MEAQLARKQFDWKAFKRWRTIQIASLLPLILTGVFVLYFRQAPQLGITAFFLILIVGFVLPQIQGELALSHIIITREIEERLQEFEKRMGNLIGERLAEAQARKSATETPIS